MPLTADEKTALNVLQKSINALRRHYDSIDPATDFPMKLETGEALRKLINLQSQLIQSAMDRDLPFKATELQEIKTIGDDIKDAAKKQQRVKNALKLVSKLALK